MINFDLHRFWLDKDGKLTLVQAPNVFLIGWICCLILVRVARGSDIEQLTSIMGFGFLVVWALLEVLSGVNYFRRLLGLVVLVYAVVSRLP